MKIQEAVLVEIIPTTIWIESGMCGERVVMVQHTGSYPFEYACFNYDYQYTHNSGTLAAAEGIARQLGAADPIEHRQRKLELPTVAIVRDKIAKWSAVLAEMENEATSETTVHGKLPTQSILESAK